MNLHDANWIYVGLNQLQINQICQALWGVASAITASAILRAMFNK